MPRNIDFTQQPVEVRLAAHAIGLDHKRPYLRQGRYFYRAYRNYYTAPSKVYGWEKLVSEGLASTSPGRRKDSVWYSVTDAGLSWLGEILDVEIIYEED